MNTHLVDRRTVWAVLAMELGLALPLISLPAQGDRFPGATGAVLLAVLLPAGYVAVQALGSLRDPSWRILAGIGLGLLSRTIVSVVPEGGPIGLMTWFARSIVPISIGVALWWRGAALSTAELTAADVRNEFSLLSICLLGTLGLVRPFLLGDSLFLGASVGIFAVGGLIGIVLSRQDAADLSLVPFGRLLGVGTALLPAVAGGAIVAILRPSLLGSMWLLLARLVELALTPLGLLVAWIASLIPRGGPSGPVQPLVRPMPQLSPDPSTLAQLEDRLGWLSYVVLFTLLACAAIFAMLLVRVMLDNWLGPPRRTTRPGDHTQVTVDAVGEPGADAQDLIGWIARWLRRRFARPARASARAADARDAVSAWAAYQRLLDWAARHDLARRPPETARELQSRLVARTPDVQDPVALVTETYELERYGGQAASAERLERVRDAIAALPDG